jgi:hypothetical protein
MAHWRPPLDDQPEFDDETRGRRFVDTLFWVSNERDDIVIIVIRGGNFKRNFSQDGYS